MKNGMKIIAAMAVTFLATNASADIVISSPMDLNDQYIVGTISGGPLGSEAAEKIAAQTLLDLNLGQVSGVYSANTAYDYSGILVGTPYKDSDGSPLKITGWDYVMAKYDGPNAGYVLFSTGGQDITIPQYPSNFWTESPDKWAISHWTAFNATPGTPVPEPATMLLFGAGLVGLAGIARRKIQ